MTDIYMHANISLGQLDPSGEVEMPKWMLPTEVITVSIILLIFLPTEIYVLVKTGRGIDC